MPEIDLILPSLLSDATGLPRHNKLIAATLANALEQLRKHPKISPHVFEADGQQRQHVLFFYNEENTRWIESHEIALKSTDVLQIIQAISGG